MNLWMDTMKRDKNHCYLDHANKQRDRERMNPNLASKRQATQRQAAASKFPPGAADLSKTGTDDKG